jgi:hypothetical protein
MVWRMIWSRSRPPPARALAHLRRDPRRDAVEERPAGLQERDPALELRLAHRPLLGRRGREGDAPEVGRTGSDPVLNDLEGPGAVELACHPGETRDRPVALPIGLKRLQGELGAPRAPTPPWPVDAEGHRPLPLGPAFDDGADGHGPLLHRGNSVPRPTAARRATARTASLGSVHGSSTTPGRALDASAEFMPHDRAPR